MCSSVNELLWRRIDSTPQNQLGNVVRAHPDPYGSQFKTLLNLLLYRTDPCSALSFATVVR